MQANEERFKSFISESKREISDDDTTKCNYIFEKLGNGSNFYIFDFIRYNLLMELTQIWDLTEIQKLLSDFKNQT